MTLVYQVRRLLSMAAMIYLKDLDLDELVFDDDGNCYEVTAIHRCADGNNQWLGLRQLKRVALDAEKAVQALWDGSVPGYRLSLGGVEELIKAFNEATTEPVDQAQIRRIAIRAFALGANVVPRSTT